METTCHDTVFGLMIYRHQWQKKSTLNFLGQMWPILVAAQAYTGKPITTAEQESFVWVKKNWHSLQGKAEEALKNYIVENRSDLAQYWPAVRGLESRAEIAKAVTPRMLLFQRDGSAVLFLDCQWDQENGLGIQLYPAIEVAAQAAFL